MSRFSDAQLDDIKARNPCDQVAAQWVTLRRHGKKMMGPCPLHSPDPHAKDSTGFECDAEGWVCACCSDGGDVIKLMMKREGIEFTAAVERLGGAREIDPVEDAKAEAARAVRKIEREAEHNTWRDRERGRAWDLLKYTRPIGGTLAERYLREIRGLVVPADVQLWFDPAARLYVEDRPKFRLVHSGPAMLAKIQRDGRFAGVHTTWLDLARPKGKARIVDSKSGAELPSKKVRGSKKGGHIDLTGCKDDPRELVLGEGIEKVLAIWTAYAASGRDLTRTAFWTSVDLGNLAGKASSSVPHPSMKTDKGRVPRVPGPDPDLDTPSIAIPDTVDRLVLLGDSTSDPFTTQCVMARAAKRYAREGRTVVCAWAPAANDFDDLLREAQSVELCGPKNLTN